MKTPPSSLIGPAAAVLTAGRTLLTRRDRAALLLDGDPGVGKTAVLDQLALEVTDTPYAIEHVNGQSLSVDLVRQWRERGPYGNLFAPWTVKRIDEIDAASSSAIAEMLSFLDYLPKGLIVLASTNEFTKLRTATKGRLESRFHRFHVDAPSVEETTAHLVKALKVPKTIAQQIARGSVPEGCLITAGCNVRAAVRDAEAYLAVREAQQERRAA